MKVSIGYRSVGIATGLPFNWQDEQSGELSTPINSYLSGKPMTEEEVEAVRAYLEYYINAPCWDTDEKQYSEILAGLRKTIARGPKTTFQIGIWIHRCLDIGIDPL